MIDAKAIDLPMLDRMYKEYPKGAAPERLETLAGKIRDADGFVFITGEYNWGMQPGLKNLTDHFLEEWFWRPAAIASYSAGRFSGARAATAWHGTLCEMGMVVVSSTLAVGPIAQTLRENGEPIGEAGKELARAFPGLRMISRGGSRRPRRSGRRGRRRIEGRAGPESALRRATNTSSRRRRGPITTGGYDWASCSADTSASRRRGVLVPAFARTTRSVCRRLAKISDSNFKQPHLRDLATQCARALPVNVPPSPKEGVRNAGRPVHRSLECKVETKHTS